MTKNKVGRPKAKDTRVQLKVPSSFHAKVMAAANEHKIDATVMLEKSEVVYVG